MADALSAGEVLRIGSRMVRISSMPDMVTPCKDHRGRIAVRNVSTNRLSYIPEWTLLKAKGIPIKAMSAAVIPTHGEPLRTVLLAVLARYGIFPGAWINQNGDQFMTDLMSIYSRGSVR